MFRSVIALIIVLCFVNQAHTAPNKKEYKTKKTNKQIHIDGQLTDEAWQNVLWDQHFQMYYPYDNKAATYQTKFAIVYDENYVYVAIKAFDSNPEEIIQRVTRRDDIDGDYVGVQFDSYNDEQTAYCFNVSASGSKQDIFISGDGNTHDESYNPIWWVATAIDTDGWMAELKIPFSQFRFVNKYEQTWGVQIKRFVQRIEEVSLWQPIKRDDPGWVHHYGKMKGLVDIKPKKVMDFYPYAVAGINTYEKEVNNPYRDGSDFIGNVGLDGKIGLTNNLTLDFTVNPDFGQVEADPSNVNLTGFELFFPEKRPFFVEGNNILSFPLIFGDGDLANDNPYYSRRIGRRPHYDPVNDIDTAYSKVPNNTTILGAAKITGRTDNGLSIGVLETVTQAEMAKYCLSTEDDEKELIAEPLTNYSMVSLRQELDSGNTLLGGVITSVNRHIDAENLKDLHRNAYSGGVDFTRYWKEKTWFITAKGVISQVNGDKAAITTTQQSLIHNFNRPNADYIALDTNATELSGFGGNVFFGKSGGGRVNFVSGVYFKSPGLELNDFGFIRHADDIITVNWLGYRINEPFSVFRNVGINVNHWANFDFGGNYLGMGGNLNAHGSFKNYYNISAGINFDSEKLSNTHLRGGPSYRLPGGSNVWFWLGSDSRKKFKVNANLSISSGFEHYYNKQWYSLSLSYQPLNILQISIAPAYNVNINDQQYFTLVENSATQNTEYILAKLKRQTLSTEIRANLNITPELSFQLWMQPYYSKGTYSNYKRITDPTNDNYNKRFMPISDKIQWQEDTELYTVDYNDDGITDIEFENNDFNSKFSQLNFVSRWEYQPGSVLFIVWSRNKSNFDGSSSQKLGQDMSDLFHTYPDQTFMLKLSYRIGI